MLDTTIVLSMDTEQAKEALTRISFATATINSGFTVLTKQTEATCQAISGGFEKSAQTLRDVYSVSREAGESINSGFKKLEGQLIGNNTELQKVAEGVSGVRTNTEGLTNSIKDLTKAYETQNKTAENFGKEHSKIYGAISQALTNQSKEQKTANEKLREQNKILNDQKTALNNVTDAISKQQKAVQQNTSQWEKFVNGFFVKLATESVDLIKRIAAAGLEASKVYEDMSAKLSVLTGDLDSAKKKFWELNALEDQTAIATDKLASAYLTLGNNGLRNTTQQMEKYAAIAQGTNKDITGLAQNISSFVNGRLQSLKEYGITAERNGEKLIMSFRGEKKEIEATTGALEQYLEQLADTSFSGVLEARTGTLTASFERYNNAWGTFTTRIMDGSDGAGQALKVFVDTGTDLLNDLADTFNSPEYKLFFENLTKDFNAALEEAKTWCSSCSEEMQDFWNTSGLAAATGCDSMMQSFQHFFNYARIALLSLAKYAVIGWEAVSGTVSAHWEGLKTTLTELSFEKGQQAYSQVMDQARKNVSLISEQFDDTIGSYLNDIAKEKQRLQDIKNGYRDLKPGEVVNYRSWENPKENNTESGNNRSIKGTSPGTSSRKGGGSGRAQEARDTWTPYYQQLKELDMKSKSDLEKLEWEHAKKLQEYQKIIAENSQASEAEKANALLIINTAYQEDRKKIEKEAHDFIRSLDPEEAELMRLEEGYRNKLEQLEQFHEDQLVSEQVFLEKREELRNQFEQDKKDFQKKKDAEKNDFFSKEDLENIKLFQGGMNDLSDAFSNLTEGMSKSSAAYKAMFAMQKGFAVASATMNAIVAWTKALSAPDTTSWYQSLANYASAVALTTGIIQQLASITMHDKGGKLNPGEWGIVGEYGPELIQGPVSVTSRRETADLARSAMSGGDVIVNLYESNDKAGSVESEDDNDTRIINIFVSDIRRGGEMSDAIQNTFNLKRIGA